MMPDFPQGLNAEGLIRTIVATRPDVVAEDASLAEYRENAHGEIHVHGQELSRHGRTTRVDQPVQSGGGEVMMVLLAWRVSLVPANCPQSEHHSANRGLAASRAAGERPNAGRRIRAVEHMRVRARERKEREREGERLRERERERERLRERGRERE